MHPIRELQTHLNRRQLLANTARPLGGAALASLLGQPLTHTANAATAPAPQTGLPGLPHFAPRAKRVIYLFMCGGPSHIDTFDFHPRMRDLHGIELPSEIRGDQRITGMTSGQKSFPVVAPMFQFQRHGEHGTWVSEILPHMSKMVDEITVIKSIHTEAINHDPAITFINTGVQ
ncbi:MAG TPA: sulfatase, partial [Planctomycetaceae bacterium]|nr:sulfatase [Planctomycetaceae bacterium]